MNKIQLSRNIVLKRLSQNEFALEIKGVQLSNLGLIDMVKTIKRCHDGISSKTPEAQLSYKLYKGIRYNDHATTALINDSELKSIDSTKLMNKLREVAKELDYSIEYDIERQKKNREELSNLNERIDRILNNAGLANMVSLKYFNTKRYACSKKYKSKEELQRLYERFITKLTDSQSAFKKASDLKKTVTPTRTFSGDFTHVTELNNYSDSLVVISKKSKWLDFLSAFYTIEKMEDMLDTSADEAGLLLNINISSNILYLMGYKLGILDIDKGSLYRISKEMSNEDKLQLLKIELALGLR